MSALRTVHIRRSTRQAEIDALEADIRQIARKRAGETSDDERAVKKPKGPSLLAAELAKYSKGKGKAKKKGKGEDDVLATLNSFRSKLQGVMDVDDEVPVELGEDGEMPPAGAEDPGVDVDDDLGFLSHHLRFPKGNEDEVAKAEREYEVIDPRARGAKAKEEERQRKRAQRPKDGGRGSRR